MPRLYAHAAASAARCASAARHPDRNDSGTAAVSAASAAAATAPPGSAPRATGLSRLPARASRSRSTQSLLHPTDTWPASTAAATPSVPAAPRPTLAANAAATAVTVTVGSGWQARTSARSVPDPVRTAPSYQPPPARRARGACGARPAAVPALPDAAATPGEPRRSGPAAQRPGAVRRPGRPVVGPPRRVRDAGVDQRGAGPARPARHAPRGRAARRRLRGRVARAVRRREGLPARRGGPVPHRRGHRPRARRRGGPRGRARAPARRRQRGRGRRRGTPRARPRRRARDRGGLPGAQTRRATGPGHGRRHLVGAVPRRHRGRTAARRAAPPAARPGAVHRPRATAAGVRAPRHPRPAPAGAASRHRGIPAVARAPAAGRPDGRDPRHRRAVPGVGRQAVTPAEALDAARGLVPAFAKRAAAHDRDGTFPVDDVADLAAAGLLALMTPARLGGVGASFAQYAEVAVVLAEGSAATALVFNMHASVTGALALTPDDVAAALGVPPTFFAMRDRVLRATAEDCAFYAVAMSERGVGSRLSQLRTSYVPVAGGWRIAGSKAFCSGAGHADGYLVAARNGERVSHFLVPAGPGVTVEETWA